MGPTSFIGNIRTDLIRIPLWCLWSPFALLDSYIDAFTCPEGRDYLRARGLGRPAALFCTVLFWIVWDGFHTLGLEPGAYHVDDDEDD